MQQINGQKSNPQHVDHKFDTINTILPCYQTGTDKIAFYFFKHM